MQPLGNVEVKHFQIRNLQTLTDVCCSSDVQMFLKFSCKSLWHVRKMSKLNLTLCLQRNEYYLEWKHHSQNPVRKTSTQY